MLHFHFIQSMHLFISIENSSLSHKLDRSTKTASANVKEVTITLFLYYYFWPHHMTCMIQNLSSLTRDRTYTSCSGSMESFFFFHVKWFVFNIFSYYFLLEYISFSLYWNVCNKKSAKCLLVHISPSQSPWFQDAFVWLGTLLCPHMLLYISFFAHVLQGRIACSAPWLALTSKIGE